MPTPVDVNSPMTQVFGHVLRLDDPLLGDNPKVAAIKAEQSAASIKQVINDALAKFFFPAKPEPDPNASPLETESTTKTESSDQSALLVSLFKMIVETLFRKRSTKEV
jgi:hypothetical protein